MTFWDYLDRRGIRAAQRESRILPHDFRGWVAFGLFVQSTGLFALMQFNHDIMDNQGFMTLASAVVVTGWIGGVAAFAYSAGKQQGEATALAAQAMDLAANAGTTPAPVTVVNGPDAPVPVADAEAR